MPENSDYLKGTLLQDHFNACVNAARADYRGNLTTPWTRKDTKVDVMDNIGIQNSDSPDGFSYEAAWGKTGTADAPVYKAIVPQVKVGDIVTAIDQFKPRFAKCADQIPQAKADEPKANPNYKLPPGVTLPMLFTDKSHPALIVIQSIANTAVECTPAGPDDSR